MNSAFHQLWLFPFRMGLCAMLVAATWLLRLTLPLMQLLLPSDSARVSRRWSSRHGTMDSQAGLRRLIDLNRIATQSGARVFPISGTLLGIERQGAPLAHDTDIDVGLYADDPGYHRFIDALRNSPMTVAVHVSRYNLVTRLLNPWIPPLPDNTILYKFMLRDPGGKPDPLVNMEVFVHFRSLGLDVHGGANRLWINTPIELGTSDVGGEPMLTPSKRHLYLTENYGDYNTERVDFESATDCPNVVNIYRPSAVIWLIHKHYLYSRAGWTHRLEILDVQRRDMIRHLLCGPSVRPDWRVAGDGRG